ncbi:MAG TPA: LysM peptidoglycan-binding domain-containing protein, partial [Candidatus Binatia bacterium]|nr:LysM peptidoglycan-binding domain-containing protein [Candidatus Binatia bacterium]
MNPSRAESIGARLKHQKSLPIFFLLVALLSLFSHRYTAGQEQLPLSDQLTGGEFSYVVQKGDSLTSIGAKFGIGARYLAAINDLSASGVLKIGQQLRIDNRHIVPAIMNDGIVINIPQRMLFHFKEARLRRAIPVGLGRQDWPTPTGSFK